MKSSPYKYAGSRLQTNLSNVKKFLFMQIFIILILVGCTTKEENKTTPKNTSDRFELVEKITFLDRKANIIIDKKTGIKYLHIWEEDSNWGGEAITRLWDK